MLSANAIVLLYGTRVGIPVSLASFVVMNRPVDPVSNIPMSTRSWYLMPRSCGVSYVL